MLKCFNATMLKCYNGNAGMNHDRTAQRATSAHPLSFLLLTEEGNAAMLQCHNNNE
jgi:hypothetical protein